jgi:hypothetical protein
MQSPVVYQVNVHDSSRCPICNQSAGVIVVRRNSSTQFIWCFIIFLLFWPLCFVPFCMDQCSDIEYVCSSCQGIRTVYRAPFCPT